MRDMLRTLLYVLIFCAVSAAAIGIVARVIGHSSGSPPRPATAPSATMPHEPQTQAPATTGT